MLQKKFTFLLLILLSVFANATDNPKSINPENTYVLIIGVLQWESSSLSPFSKTNRKDEELYKLLLSKGVKPENAVFLKDEEATLMNILKRLKELLNKTTVGSSFIFYYAGHGVRNGNGPVSFANYDYKSAQANGLEADAIGDQINKLFKGKQVWLLADCCYSGVLLEQAKKISSTGSRSVVAFTSSSASNSSTANWTFTQTIIDCLSGLSICDRNADKKISISEVRDELFDAMRFRERQMSGTAFFNTPESSKFNLAEISNTTTSQPVQYVYVSHNEKFQPARVLSIKDKMLTGELYHYSDKKQITIPVVGTKPIDFAEYPVGLNVLVEWSGKYYPAVIKELKKGFHYIKYTGWDDSWNEWVTYDRIVTNNRKKCSVEWQGGWYPAEILQEKDGKYFIHYTGYGKDWDEWVTSSRVRL